MCVFDSLNWLALIESAINVIPICYTYRRGLAFGILELGSALGWVMYPIMIDHTAQLLGLGWAMDVLALSMLPSCLITIGTVRSPDTAGTGNSQPEGLIKAVRQSVIYRSRGR